MYIIIHLCCVHNTWLYTCMWSVLYVPYKIRFVSPFVLSPHRFVCCAFPLLGVNQYSYYTYDVCTCRCTYSYRYAGARHMLVLHACALYAYACYTACQ